MPAPTRIILSLLLTAGPASACATSEPKEGETSAPEQPRPTTVAIQLPAGLGIAFDGEDKGRAPIGPFVAEDGEHTVTVTSPCGAFLANVRVNPGVANVVATNAFESSAFADLRVEATGPEGELLTPTVKLGDWVVPASAKTSTKVPACKLRLSVVNEGLGGFIEDLDLVGGQTYDKTIALPKAGDMIRIQGGNFVLGPPEKHAKAWDFIPRRPVQIETFDLDRHEVTAEDLHRCRSDGGCEWIPKFVTITRPPFEEVRQACTTDPSSKERDLRPDKGQHPANCVARWEAEQYCKTVGKRLPTSVEWEFAARSRNADYSCPWGDEGDGACEVPSLRRPRLRGKRNFAAGPFPVCTKSKDTTEQGLCDMLGNVKEYVTGGDWQDDHRGAHYAGGEPVLIRGGHGGARSDSGQKQDTTLGFRCARDASTTTTEHQKRPRR